MYFIFKKFLLIKYFFLRFFVRKYKISAIKNYGFIVNDYLINFNNDLDLLFYKYGSDKGGRFKSRHVGWNPHNYAQIYNDLFFSYRQKKFNFLEIGIGSVDKNVRSSLPSFAKTGASLRAFRDYFFKANIYGCDIDDKVLFKENRIKTFCLDQTSKKQVKSFFKKQSKNFLIVIDDGLHTFEANISFFEIAIKYLIREQGIYIIEDINEFDLKRYYDYFSKSKKSFKVNFYNLHNCNFKGKSNNFILIRKIY
jgi:hypothetical protein